MGRMRDNKQIYNCWNEVQQKLIKLESLDVSHKNFKKCYDELDRLCERAMLCQQGLDNMDHENHHHDEPELCKPKCSKKKCRKKPRVPDNCCKPICKFEPICPRKCKKKKNVLVKSMYQKIVAHHVANLNQCVHH